MMFSISHHPGRLDQLSTKALPNKTQRPRAFVFSLLVLALSFNTLPAQAAKNKKPSVKISKVAPVNEGASVNLSGTATDKDGQIASYLWEQTKGSPAVTITSANAAVAGFTAPTLTRSNKKTKPAKLTFKLTATDNGTPALTASKTVVVTVKPVIQAPTANAGADQSVGLNTAVTLNANSSNDTQDGGQIVKWQWKQLSSGVSKAAKVKLQNAKTAVATFTSPVVAPTSPLQFELTITDNDGKVAKDTVTITVSGSQPQALAANFDISDTTPTAGDTITASTTPSGGTAPYSVSFDWGDNSTPSTGSQTSATHTYATAGSYTLTTTVKDSANPQDTKVNTSTITVAAVVTPLSGTLSLAASQVEFNAPVQATINNIAGGTKPYKVTFVWGDGQTSGPTTLADNITGINDEHFYELVGTYTVKATITDANNLTQDYTTTATVTEVQAPLVDCN